MLAIDEYDLPFDLSNKGHCIRRECGRGYEHAPTCSKTFQASGETLHERPTDRVLPSLCLYINQVEPEFVLYDDSLVAGPNRGRIGVDSALNPSLGQADLAEQILKTGVGPEEVELGRGFQIIKHAKVIAADAFSQPGESFFLVCCRRVGQRGRDK